MNKSYSLAESGCIDFFLIVCYLYVNVNTLIGGWIVATYKMKDIAQMAGVSIATVSRVIHQNGYVSVENREKIEKILEETGFVPNRIASGLKKSKSRLIGHMTLFNQNMLYEKISEAINREASENGYHVLTMTSHRGSGEEKNQVDQLIGQQVDGVIITSNGSIDPGLVSKMTGAGIPIVMVERCLKLKGVDRILVDDRQGAYGAVKHMIDQGHRKIGFIGIQSQHEVERLRLLGYKCALEEAGVTIQDTYISYSQTYNVGQGKAGIEDIYNRCSEDGLNFPTAFFATSDVLAAGILQFCYEKQLRIPEDISIIGYDDTLSLMMAPPISSMALPEEEIGVQGVRLLKRRMENKVLEVEEVVVEPYLVDRQTVKKL